MILYVIVFYFMVLSVFTSPPSFNLLHSVESTPKQQLTTHHSRQHINFSSVCEIYWWFSIRSGGGGGVLSVSPLWNHTMDTKGLFWSLKSNQKVWLGTSELKKTNMTNGYHWNSGEVYLCNSCNVFFLEKMLEKWNGWIRGLLTVRCA